MSVDLLGIEAGGQVVGSNGAVARVGNPVEVDQGKPMTEEYLTVEELARRLGWKPNTVLNKMTGKDAIFTRGVHFDSPPGMPTLFRWSAVLALYQFDGERTMPTAAAGARLAGEKRARTIGA